MATVPILNNPAIQRNILLNMMVRLSNKLSDGNYEFWHFMNENTFLVHNLAQSDAINPFYKNWFSIAHQEMLARLNIHDRAKTLATLKTYGVTSEKRYSVLPDEGYQLHCLSYKGIYVPYAGLGANEQPRMY